MITTLRILSWVQTFGGLGVMGYGIIQSSIPLVAIGFIVGIFSCVQGMLLARVVKTGS